MKITVLALWLFSVAAAAECRVQSVHDGDTLTARCDGKMLKVRLMEIDAPERTQLHARRSTDHLKKLCVGQIAELHHPHLDRYGRTLARVYCSGVDASAEQVRAGYAWAFDKYLTDPEIKRLEGEAKAAKRGLWAGHEPLAPWEFRHTPVR